MNKYLILFLLGIPLLALMASCEGSAFAKGVVKDKITDQPLDSVLCKVTTGTMEIYTDSTGQYDVHNGIGECIGGCKEIAVEFSRRGYKTVLKKDREASGVIYLEK